MSFSSPLPHHTHYLVDKVTPSAPFLQATMSLLHPVLPTFFDTFHELAKPPAYPDPFPLPEPPEPPTEEQLAAAPKAYEREMNAWERSLLALNPDVGSDWRRWWGHGAMEVSWGRRPREEMFLPGKEAGLSQFEPRGWARDGRRRGMFQGVVVVSYRNLQSSVSSSGFGTVLPPPPPKLIADLLSISPVTAGRGTGAAPHLGWRLLLLEHSAHRTRYHARRLARRD